MSAGIPGVWFYSLECDQPLAVAAARADVAGPPMHQCFVDGLKVKVFATEKLPQSG